MSRHPYRATQPDNWYLQNRFFVIYMLRELTSVPVALAALNLFWGLAALAGSREAWLGWIAWQQSTGFIVFNLLALVVALFNGLKWFEAMPKAIRIPKGDGFVADRLLIIGNWIAVGGVCLILLIAIAWLA